MTDMLNIKKDSKFKEVQLTDAVIDSSAKKTIGF